VVAGHPIHAPLRESRAAEDVAAADHNADLDAQGRQLRHLLRHLVQHLRIDAVVLGAHEGLTAKLEKDTLVGGLA
jgi:hypothetical protein